MDAKQLGEALAHAERSVKGARVCRPAHGLLASILLKLGRAADAEEVVTSALTLQTGSADAYDGLAFISMSLGEHERANQLYRRTTELAPRDLAILVQPGMQRAKSRTAGGSRASLRSGQCDRCRPLRELSPAIRAQGPDGQR
jgi:Flp pilus assembly protein TadD